MNRAVLTAAPLAALLLVAAGGARAQSAPAAPAAGAPAARLPATAVCAVCGPRDGASAEPVVAGLVHRGKTYTFCREACKAEFQQDPDRWIRLATEAVEGRDGAAVPKPDGEPEHRHGSGGVGPAGGAGGGQSAAPS